MAALVIVASGETLSGHRRDEYLQASRLALDADRVRIEVELTAGIAVADAVLADLDRDGTDTVSAGEAASYAAAVAAAIGLEIDGAPLAVTGKATRVPGVDDVRSGAGAMLIELDATVPALDAGPHLLRFRNRHRPDISVYLANVLVPTDDRVAVTAQRRDVDQRELVVDYQLRAGSIEAAGRTGLAIATALLIALGAWWWHVRRRPTASPA